MNTTTKELDNGLIQVEFSGVDLANYLRLLDYMAHGGANADTLDRNRSAESIRMYDEISDVLDGITTRPDPKDPPPHVLVNTAYLGAKNKKRRPLCRWEAGRTEPRPLQRAAYAQLLEKLSERFPAPAVLVGFVLAPGRRWPVRGGP
ncbi:hypothetical protein [Streptomyces sp. NPDC057325]|uniref:hypothetical protein n=1 Tax=unclassified Streptomyces TaxID=2593676 RepID=UPI00363068BD